MFRTRLEGFAVARTYSHKQQSEILADLVDTMPGNEGKWFAAAKEAGLYDEALEFARRAPCDPKTLMRAARDLAAERPVFAVEAGLLALRWLGRIRLRDHGHRRLGRLL